MSSVALVFGPIVAVFWLALLSFWWLPGPWPWVALIAAAYLTLGWLTALVGAINASWSGNVSWGRVMLWVLFWPLAWIGAL